MQNPQKAYTAPSFVRRAEGRTRRAVYVYILDFVRENGYAPTIREIALGLGLGSPGTVHRHVRELASMGWISRDAHKARAIRITERG